MMLPTSQKTTETYSCRGHQHRCCHFYRTSKVQEDVGDNNKFNAVINNKCNQFSSPILIKPFSQVLFLEMLVMKFHDGKSSGIHFENTICSLKNIMKLESYQNRKLCNLKILTSNILI